MAPSLRQRVAFLWAERFLLARRDSVQRELAHRLGRPLRLVRYPNGRGWGIKYVDDPARPTLLVKLASRVIERRLRWTQGENYLAPEERYRREAAVIEALAREDLGPQLVAAGDCWFARRFLPGQVLSELPPERLAAVLTRVLAALDRAAEAGIFHTDTNSNNIIVSPQDGRVGFIDSEWPAVGPLAGLNKEAVRRYCHRRLLFTLGRDYPAAADPAFRERLLYLATAYYGTGGGPLSREEAAQLFVGRGFTAWRVE